jgi:hypothetical protein
MPRAKRRFRGRMVLPELPQCPLRDDLHLALSSPIYAGPADPAAVGEDDVHEALEYLISIEPAYMAQFQPDITRAMTTLRAFVAQRQPQDLTAMREICYELTNDDRYLETEEIAGVVRSALSEAWDGIGPWRK